MTETEYVRIYVDHPRELVDIEYTDHDSPCGSNWSIETREQAERTLIELLHEGYSRGHMTAPYA